MAQHRVELVGRPVPQRTTIEAPGEAPPRELPITIEQGPPIQTEEGGDLPRVRTYAVYVFHQVDAEGVAVYAYSRQGTVQ